MPIEDSDYSVSISTDSDLVTNEVTRPEHDTHNTQDTQNTPVLPLQPWLPDIPDPGWPEHALPVMYPFFIPPALYDDKHRQEPCQCLLVDAVKGPFGPFSLQDKCYCWTCLKPVTPGQTPTTVQVRWVIIAHRMIQKWNWRWWSALPAVRQYPPQWNWFEGYATHKYNLQLDRFVERD